MKLFAFKVYRAVNKCSGLKFMSVVILFFGKILNEMNVFSISYINCTGSFSAEFMEMFIGKVGMKFHFMEMIMFIFAVHSFTGYCAESVIVAVTIFVENTCASGEFMNMFLLFVTIIIIHFKNYFFFYDMTIAVVCEKEDFLMA